MNILNKCVAYPLLDNFLTHFDWRRLHTPDPNLFYQLILGQFLYGPFPSFPLAVDEKIANVNETVFARKN